MPVSNNPPGPAYAAGQPRGLMVTGDEKRRYPSGPHNQGNEQPQIIITDESDKGPDQAKKPTSWAPNIKVLAGAGVGTPLAGVLIWVLGEFGVEMPWDVALYFAGLIILAVAYFVPEKKS